MRSWTFLVRAGLLAAFGCGPPPTWYGLGPDHRTTYAVSRSDGRSCVEVGAGDRACFDAVALQRIIFSPDGRHMAYAAREAGAWFVVRDGTRGPRTDGIGEMTFSPDGRRLAYAGMRDGAWHVVVDDRFGAPVDSLFAGSLGFDPTSTRLAYVALVGGSAVAVVDGQPGPAHDGIARLRFSPDGKHVGYVARDGGSVRMSVDAVLGPEHEAIPEFAFGPSGDEPAYVARDAGVTWVVRGDARYGPYLEARDLGFRLPEGDLGFVIREEAGERVVLEGNPGPLFVSVDPPVFGPSRDAWGYVAHDAAGATVVVAGEEVDAQLWAGNLVFNADGSRYAYLVRHSHGDAVVDDRGVRTFDIAVDGTLQFLPDAHRWACLAGELEERRLYVAVEGEDRVRPFDWETFGGVAGTRAPRDGSASGTIDALRAWVAAEARDMLREHPLDFWSAPRGPSPPG